MNLPTDLTDAERQVVEHAARGEICELGTGEPSEGAQWSEDRVVRASVIYALCCAADGSSVVHAKGVRIRGARIEGMLDFEDAVLQPPLHLLRCFIGEPMSFERARLPVLCLTGSYTHGIRADGLDAKEVVLNKGFSAKGEVQLLDAAIAGNLQCAGGTFENPGGNALSADGLECKGEVIFRNDFSAKGSLGYRNINVYGGVESPGGRTDRVQMLVQRMGWPLPVLQRVQMWWPWSDPKWQSNAESDPALQLVWSGVVLNPLLFGGTLWMVLVLPFVVFINVRRRRRIARNCCPKCAYPRGSSQRCSECGDEVRPPPKETAPT